MTIIIGLISGIITICEGAIGCIKFLLGISIDLHLKAKLYKTIYKADAYRLVSSLVGATSNQSSPPAMPVAINRKEICDLMNSMLWLILNNEVGNGVAVNVYKHITENEYDYEYYKKNWHDPLLASYENDISLIQVYSYDEIRDYSIRRADGYVKRLYQWMLYQHRRTDYKHYFSMLIIVFALFIVAI